MCSDRIIESFLLFDVMLSCLQEQEEFWTICFSRMKLTKISSILVAAGKRGVIRVIDLTRMKCEHSFIGHTGSIHEVKVSPSDASLLLSAGNDRSIRLWSIDTLMCVAVFSGHRAQVLTVDFNASGDRFLSGSVDNSVRIWNLPTSEIERAKGATCTGPHKVYEADFSTLAIHENYVDSAHWFGDLIFSKSSGSNSQKIVCWQPLQDGSARFLHDFPTQNCKNWSMRFNLSYDHTMMALGTDNGKTYVWDLNKPNPTDIKGIRLPNTYSTSSIRQTAFSRDGKVLICGAEDGTILRWDRVE